MYINPIDSIKLKNVVAQKYKFNINDIDKTLEKFIKTVVDNGFEPQGLAMYSINNIPLDGEIDGEFFISVKNEIIDELDELEYYSYFSIENMISTCIYDNFEIKTEEAYYRVLKYIEENNMKQITPIFNVFAGDTSLQYVFIKVGVMEKQANQKHFDL